MFELVFVEKIDLLNAIHSQHIDHKYAVKEKDRNKNRSAASPAPGIRTWTARKYYCITHTVTAKEEDGKEKQFGRPRLQPYLRPFLPKHIADGGVKEDDERDYHVEQWFVLVEDVGT